METDDIKYSEVLQCEKFAHQTEPMISFSQKNIWVNMGCLKRIPNTFYVHFLLFRQTRIFMILTGIEGMLDVVRWCTPSGKPRKIICDAELWDDIITFMNWNNKIRYRLLGRFVQTSYGGGFAFDMARAVEFPLCETLDTPPPPSNSVPQAYRTFEKHLQNPLVTKFKTDTVITIDEE